MDIGSIEERREEIARIDAEIVKMIYMRTETAGKIGLIKRDMNLPIKDHDTERKVLDRYRDLAEQYNLPKDAVESIAEKLISIAVDRQRRSND